MFQRLRAIFCVLILFSAMGATTKILGSAEGDKPGSRIDITELKRVSGNMVSLKISLVNDTSAPFAIAEDFEGPEAGPTDMQRDEGSIAGAYLNDSDGTKYGVARDARGNCMCSTGVSPVPGHSKRTLWAKFPAPADAVTKLSVTLPHFQPVEDVPLQP